MSGCSQTTKGGADADDLLSVQRLLPGDYLGQGPRGDVYHRLVKLEIPALGGPVFYHHVSREGFGGPAFQRKYYVFDAAGKTMRSTVVLGADTMPQDLGELAKTIASFSESQVLRFAEDCRFVWTDTGGGFAAELTQDRCAYESPAFGGWVNPRMTYQLDPCVFAISEAMYRRDGSPVFPPGSTQNRRLAPKPDSSKGC